MPGKANRMSRTAEITASDGAPPPGRDHRQHRAEHDAEEHDDERTEHRRTAHRRAAGRTRRGPGSRSRAVPGGRPDARQRRFGRFGSYGASSGPKIAASIAIAMTAADSMPGTPVARSRPNARPPGRRGRVTRTGMAVLIRPSAPQRHARVEHRVQHVDQHVDDDEREDEHQRDALHDGQVLVCRAAWTR